MAGYSVVLTTVFERTFERTLCHGTLPVSGIHQNTALQNKFQQALHPVTLKVKTCSGTLKLVSKFVVQVSDWRSVTRPSETTQNGVVR